MHFCPELLMFLSWPIWHDEQAVIFLESFANFDFELISSSKECLTHLWADFHAQVVTLFNIVVSLAFYRELKSRTLIQFGVLDSDFTAQRLANLVAYTQADAKTLATWRFVASSQHRELVIRLKDMLLILLADSVPLICHTDNDLTFVLSSHEHWCSNRYRCELLWELDRVWQQVR